MIKVFFCFVFKQGTALMFSLHLCRAVTAATLPDDSSDGKKKLLHALADKLPTILSKPARTLSLVSQQNKEKAVKVETPQKEASVSEFFLFYKQII